MMGMKRIKNFLVLETLRRIIFFSTPKSHRCLNCILENLLSKSVFNRKHILTLNPFVLKKKKN